MDETASSDNDVSAAIIALFCHLPEKFQGLWWTIDEYWHMLRRGGLKDDLNAALVRAAIRTDESSIFSSNRSKNKRKYLIGDAIWPGFVPKDQEEKLKRFWNNILDEQECQVSWLRTGTTYKNSANY